MEKKKKKSQIAILNYLKIILIETKRCSSVTAEILKHIFPGHQYSGIQMQWNSDDEKQKLSDNIKK